MTHAPWAILSSRAATASGLCRPSAFGMYVRRDGCGRYSPVDPSVEVLEIGLEVRLVVLPCHPVHARSGLALEREERRPECVDIEMVEKCGEPLFLPVPCSLSYAAQRLGHALPALGPVCSARPRNIRGLTAREPRPRPKTTIPRTRPGISLTSPWRVRCWTVACSGCRSNRRNYTPRIVGGCCAASRQWTPGARPVGRMS